MALLAQAKATAARVGEKKTLRQLVSRDRHLLLMFLPVFIFYIVFCYLPMAGLAMAFQDFKMGSGFVGVFTSEWVGLKWFKYFFHSPNFTTVLWNTVILSLYGLVAGFPVPILLALMLHNVPSSGFKRVTQTVANLPISFRPWSS